MSTYDTYESHKDPTPKVRKVSGPFAAEERLKTVAEAVAFCERKGLDPSEVRLAHNYAMWESVETDEEVATRLAYWRKSQEEHLARIREMYQEYTERGLYPEEDM